MNITLVSESLCLANFSVPDCLLSVAQQHYSFAFVCVASIFQSDVFRSTDAFFLERDFLYLFLHWNHQSPDGTGILGLVCATFNCLFSNRLSLDDTWRFFDSPIPFEVKPLLRILCLHLWWCCLGPHFCSHALAGSRASV